ncbi:SAVED domain-containing protein [Marinicrinis lubricantis]|uniref:SAVED domain-containing protein n=1 Tax=Marinicrinis lubricantis TaxID=2086470 RepID=A0ABW1IMZ9_9BACL
MTDNNKSKPSLLEAESQGGDTAETGFDFQTSLILSKIPFWLSFEGFDSLIREGVADFEAKFFSPAEGIAREALEAKNHHIAPKEFWEEIERFKELDEGSPGTFGRFTLCCNGISEDIKPLINGLRRIRDPQPFYEDSSGVAVNSYADYVDRVRKFGKDENMAKFLYKKVLIEPNWNLLSDEQTAKGLFQEQLLRHLPDYLDIPGRDLAGIFNNLLALIRSNKARPITRKQIEETMQSAISEKYRTPPKPVVISTETEEVIKSDTSLQFEWASFFGGAERNYPPAVEWNSKLIPQLSETSKWIKEQRRTRRVELKGNRRISAAIAIGKVFSAVAGFAIDMDYRGELWSTDDHADSQTPDYALTSTVIKGSGDRLVVTVGIMKENLVSEVEAFMKRNEISHLSKLHLYSSQAIVSAKQANSIVEKIKREISTVAGSMEAKKIDLFYAGPTHLALFLGYRSNALPPIQCFEMVRHNEYVPTCLLR